MIECVIFDLDDTLFEEVEYCKSGFRQVATVLAKVITALSAEKIYDALWDQFRLGNSNAVFNVVLDQFDVTYDDNFIRRLIKIYRSHLPTIILPEDSKRVLDNLLIHKKLALLSDGYLPAQRLKIKALGIENYFQYIVLTEELGREFWKPSPVGFCKIVQKLNVQNPNCVYVGDNLTKDFIAPNRLGFRSIQLIRRNKLHNEPPPNSDANPEFIIESINTLPSLLKKL